jgi:DUF971 family protein
MMEQPVEITLHWQSRELEIAFSDDSCFHLSCEFLRVHSSSAEVRGRGPGQEVLQVGKQAVNVLGIEPAGSYAMKIMFYDGHDSGLYTWEYLRHLVNNQDSMWQDYLQRIKEADASRAPTR